MPIQFQDESLPPLSPFPSCSLSSRARAPTLCSYITALRPPYISINYPERRVERDLSLSRSLLPSRLLLRGIIHVINERALGLIVIVSAEKSVGELSSLACARCFCIYVPIGAGVMLGRPFNLQIIGLEGPRLSLGFYYNKARGGYRLLRGICIPARAAN